MNLIEKYMGVIQMKPLEFYRNLPDKECRECGSKIKEQHESYLYECEQCMGKHEA